MKTFIAAIVLTFLAIPLAGAQTGSGGNSSGSGQAIMAASSSLKILSPTVGQKIGSTTVSVRYEVTNSAASAASSPTYRVQLDARDPAETLDTEYDFNGLKPGPHSVTVELVDANHTPIPGSQTIVHFNTFTPGLTPATGTKQAPQTTGALAPPAIVKASMPLPASNPADRLPSAGGELPLLSMIGFGVLVGGVISALRTRK